MLPIQSKLSTHQSSKVYIVIMMVAPEILIQFGSQSTHLFTAILTMPPIANPPPNTVKPLPIDI